MPKASADYSTAAPAPASPRRGLLAGFLALPAVVAAPLALGVALAVTTAAPASAAAHPDAKLIRLCAEYLAAAEAFDLHADGEDVDDCPYWAAIQAVLGQLEGLRATTIAGLQAKARIAAYHAKKPDGSMDWSDSFTGDWPAQVAKDVLALAGAA